MDCVNGLFEFCASIAIWVSIFRALRDRSVAGISWITVGFFTTWGVWNLLYYPSLGQTMSFLAGICVVISNCIWLILLLFYRARSNNGHQKEMR